MTRLLGLLLSESNAALSLCLLYDSATMNPDIREYATWTQRQKSRDLLQVACISASVHPSCNFRVSCSLPQNLSPLPLLTSSPSD